MAATDGHALNVRAASFSVAFAQQTAGTAPEDALAAAHLLSTYLEWCAARS